MVTDPYSNVAAIFTSNVTTSKTSVKRKNNAAVLYVVLALSVSLVSFCLSLPLSLPLSPSPHTHTHTHTLSLVMIVSPLSSKPLATYKDFSSHSVQAALFLPVIRDSKVVSSTLYFMDTKQVLCVHITDSCMPFLIYFLASLYCF